MSREPSYNSGEHIVADTIADPYLRPAFSRGNQARRLVWNIVHALLYRTSPRPFHAWRSLLLRAFGATMGPDCHFYPRSKVWAPWNLHCADQVTLADEAEIYNPAPMHFGSHAIVSQGAYLCGATHDYNSPAFPLLAYEMHFGARCWVCAKAIVGPGVSLGEGAVLGLGAVATRSLEPWTVCAGSPARPVKERTRTDGLA
jgi:putative colanic acid biosynthesis acetyltransferase WcaF